MFCLRWELRRSRWRRTCRAQIQPGRRFDATDREQHAGDFGIKTYVDNPSKVDVVTAINEAQKEQLQTEGMTLNSNIAVNGRAMISVLSILVHNGTHIDAPRHMLEKGSPIDQMPLGQLVKEGVLINLPNKGPSPVITVKDIEDSGVESRLNRIPVINTGFSEKTWGKPEVPDADALSGGPGVGALMASKACRRLRWMSSRKSRFGGG